MFDAVDANASGASSTTATCSRLMAHRNEALGIWRPELTSKVLGAATGGGLWLLWSEIRLPIVRGAGSTTIPAPTALVKRIRDRIDRNLLI